MPKLSRRKLANWAALELLNNRASADVLKELAAYLIESKRTREFDLVVRDIESALAASGVITASVTSARPLSGTAKDELESMIRNEYQDVKTVSLNETIDNSVIGGYRLDLPGKSLDVTIKAKLESVRL